jgi:hypothetical protein
MKSKIKTKDDELITREELEIMFENWANKIDETARKYTDEILMKLDQIIEELVQMREERERCCISQRRA